MKTELYSHRNPKPTPPPSADNVKWKPEMEKNEIEQLWEDYGWKLFPLLLLILVLLVPRFIAWVLGHIFTTLGEGCVKFLKVTEI